MAVYRAKGTRDQLPAQMNNRLRVIDTVRAVFRRYGFEPLETPALERIETLMGKYGEDEKLIYRILKRGEGGKRGEADLALRYDLTVPLARVVAMNADLPQPFKRYQIQPVWRADRPQKGRFREFYQCDVDVVGTDSRLADAECVAVVHDALKALGFTAFTVRLNHRALLRAMCEVAGVADREAEVLVAIDKLDKIGRAGVDAELIGRGVSASSVALIGRVLDLPAGVEPLDHLAETLGARGAVGVAELREVRAGALAMGVDPACLRVDPTLARGLSYYTGPVFETVVTEPAIGSLSGGGRYDGLIGMFSGRDIPAVGVSLGLERIITVMEELGMLPTSSGSTRAYVTVFSAETRAASLRAATALRAAGVSTRVEMNRVGKLSKQFKSAAKCGARFVLVIGEDEVAAGTVTVKDFAESSQRSLPLAEAVAVIAATD